MNKDQLAELIASIDKRFDGIDKRLDGIDKRFDGVDNTFMKMFKYIEDFRAETNERFDNTAKKDDLEHLKNTMDDFIRQITDNNVEQVARDAQFAR